MAQTPRISASELLDKNLGKRTLMMITTGLFHRIKSYLSVRKLIQPLHAGQRGIFIDCGGYDGCSAVKFMVANPKFHSISFEPNPELWRYYKNIPTTLIKKGVSDKRKNMDFFIDHIDADGSSCIPGKTIIHGSPEENANCRRINIDCVSIAELLTDLRGSYDRIVLKLDVEGSEYEILDSLLSLNMIGEIDKLYAEFHWKKCGFSEERHTKLMKALIGRLDINEWDGRDFAIHLRGPEKKQWRDDLIASVFSDISVYQSVKIST